MSRALTPREGQVLEHVMAGLTAEESGRLLGISTKTVRVHRDAMRRKLKARSLAHAVAIHLDHVAVFVGGDA